MSIPQRVSATRAVQQGEHYQGRLSLALLPRLAAAVAGSAGEIEADLRFEREGRLHWLQGNLGGTLGLECRRCLKPFDWRLQVPVRLRLVYSDAEESAALAESEPLRVEESGELALREVVEDEVLLGLPMMPRCQTCENEELPVAQPPAAEPEVRRNPFAQLKR